MAVLHEVGFSQVEIAARLKIHPSTVSRALAWYRMHRLVPASTCPNGAAHAR